MGAELTFESFEMMSSYSAGDQTFSARAPYDTLVLIEASTESGNGPCEWRNPMVTLSWDSDEVDWGVCFSNIGEGWVRFLFGVDSDGTGWMINLPDGSSVPVYLLQ
jgi:hypothetical protein